MDICTDKANGTSTTSEVFLNTGVTVLCPRFDHLSQSITLTGHDIRNRLLSLRSQQTQRPSTFGFARKFGRSVDLCDVR